MVDTTTITLVQLCEAIKSFQYQSPLVKLIKHVEIIPDSRLAPLCEPLKKCKSKSPLLCLIELTNICHNNVIEMRLLNEILQDSSLVAHREYRSAVNDRVKNINELIKLKMNCDRAEFQIRVVQNKIRMLQEQ